MTDFRPRRQSLTLTEACKSLVVSEWHMAKAVTQHLKGSTLHVLLFQPGV